MNTFEQSVNAVRIAAQAADRMKSENIIAYNVGDKLGICDIMMIVSASNERQVLAIAEEIEKDLHVKDHGLKPRSREGVEEAQWILLDYGDFIVHIMHDEARDFYNLERLWRDCDQIDLQLDQAPHADDEQDGAE